MGIYGRVIEEHTNYRIVQLGGYVHYSWEFRLFLASLPIEEAERIVAQIEYQNRPRKVVEYKRELVAQ